MSTCLWLGHMANGMWVQVLTFDHQASCEPAVPSLLMVRPRQVAWEVLESRGCTTKVTGSLHLWSRAPLPAKLSNLMANENSS